MEESVIERKISASRKVYLAVQQLKRKLFKLQQMTNKCHYNAMDEREFCLIPLISPRCRLCNSKVYAPRCLFSPSKINRRLKQCHVDFVELI